MLRLRVVESARELPLPEWDRLAADRPFAASGWLRLMEECHAGNATPEYLLLERDGRLAAATVANVVRPSRAVRGLDHTLLGRLRPIARRLGLTFLPAYVCGPTRGYGTHVLAADDAAAADALIDAVEARAARAGLAAVFQGVLDDEAGLGSRLQARRYLRLPVAPVSRLDLRWNSFEAYLRHLDRQDRKTVRHQLRRGARLGTEIEPLAEIEPHAARLHALADANHRAHNRRPLPFGPELFQRLQARLGERAVVYVARRGDHIFGMSLLLRDGGVGYMTQIGVDRAAAGPDFCYFNLGYHRPIADAIAAGMRRLYYGNLMYDVKARRGMRTVGCAVYYRPLSRTRTALLRPWFGLMARLSRRRFGAGATGTDAPA